MNGWLIALAVVALIIIVVVISMLPELRRYFRMRDM